MTFNFGNNTRTNLQNTIKNKQQLHKRFCTRFKNTTNPGERTFLKQEINRIVAELKQLASQWTKKNFGSNGWVTRGYTSQSLTSKGTWGTKRNTRRTTAKRTTKSSAARRTSRSSAKRRTTAGKARRTAAASRSGSFNFGNGSFFSPFRGFTVGR